jgi:hypothetical protein
MPDRGWHRRFDDPIPIPRGRRAHSQPMGHILFKIADFLIAICVASTIAVAMWYVAYYVFGLSSLDIRTSALMGAAIFALLMAPVWFGKKPK